MRIITGKYKGRHFDVPRTFKARPTTDFAKENIFNVINAYVDWEETTALDLFAGTGSISLELLSMYGETWHRRAYIDKRRCIPFLKKLSSEI